MIIRKPFAFLIKNFRRIHIFLLILSLYVGVKLFDVYTFINRFMKDGLYDLYADPVTKHITSLLRFSVFMLVVGSVSLLVLLLYKKKKWKLYLVPVIEYISLFFVLGMIKSFFANFSDDVATTDLRLSKDLLLMFIIAQFPAIAIFFVRVSGLDYKTFNFNYDKEFLELSEEDREEIEIGMSIDKNTFIRAYKRTIRNCKYFYMEHKYICYALVVLIFGLFVSRTYNYIFVTNKTYSQGSFYTINGFSYRVNNVYYTNKDYVGDVISKGSSFVVVDMTIQNHGDRRKLKLERFHLKNGSKDYTTTNSMYATEFLDLGKTYDSVKELRKDEEYNCIIIYKVSGKLWKSRFNYFYQETSGYLRKINIKMKDLSGISRAKQLKMGDELEINMNEFNDTIIFEDLSIENEISYTLRQCDNSSNCTFVTNKFESPEDYAILAIDFSSEEVDAKKVVDFLKNYGKLNYKDSKGRKQVIDIVSAIDKSYTGKSVYIKIPESYKKSKEISIFEYSC